MHFLDAWTQLPPLDLFRLVPPAGLLALAAFVPGRRSGRIMAAIVAFFALLLAELGPRWPIGAAWSALWILVAWRVGIRRRAPDQAAPARPGGVESAAVGTLLGLALLALLVAAVARQDLDPDDSRGASYGLFMVCAGLLQLMLRRDESCSVHCTRM